MRNDLRHYVDTSMNAEEAKYKLLGDGIESLTEEMNPEEETKQYINMASASSSVKSYQRTIEVDKEDCVEDEVQKFIDGLVDTLPVGAKAKTSFVRLKRFPFCRTRALTLTLHGSLRSKISFTTFFAERYATKALFNAWKSMRKKKKSLKK